MEVGKWYRLEYCKRIMIGKIVSERSTEFTITLEGYPTPQVLNKGLIDYIIKVTNTPQELAQDKDLIQYTLTLNGNTWETLIMECDDFEEELYQLEEEFENVEITKILTPNSNGGYDLQYVKED